jgi:hypothetical protein
MCCAQSAKRFFDTLCQLAAVCWHVLIESNVFLIVFAAAGVLQLREFLEAETVPFVAALCTAVYSGTYRDSSGADNGKCTAWLQLYMAAQVCDLRDSTARAISFRSSNDMFHTNLRSSVHLHVIIGSRGLHLSMKYFGTTSVLSNASSRVSACTTSVCTQLLNYVLTIGGNAT